MIDSVRLRMLFVAFTGWVNRHQLEVIEDLREKTASSKSILTGAAYG